MKDTRLWDEMGDMSQGVKWLGVLAFGDFSIFSRIPISEHIFCVYNELASFTNVYCFE